MMDKKKPKKVAIKKKKLKVFFTGHLGTIGSEIWSLFKDCSVVGYDLKNDHNTRDAEVLDAVMPVGADLIFHLANIPHPGPQSWEEFYDTNVVGTQNLLRVAIKKKAKGIVFFSSLAALGFDVPDGPYNVPFFCRCDELLKGEKHFDWPKGKPPWDEDAVSLPVHERDDWVIESYGCSKTAQEKLLLESGIPCMVLRLGPFADPGKDVNCYSDAASKPFTIKAVKKILGGGIEPGIFHVCRPGMWGGEKLKDWLDE